MTMYETYASLLRERGVTTRDMCNATQIPESTMSMWKRRTEQWDGNPNTKPPTPSVDTLSKIARFFDVPLETFLGE